MRPASFQSDVWKHFSFLVSRGLKAERRLSNEKHSLSSECTFIEPLLMVNVLGFTRGKVVEELYEKNAAMR